MEHLSPLPEILISMALVFLFLRTAALLEARDPKLTGSRFATYIIIGRYNPPSFLSWKEQRFRRPEPIITAKPPDYLLPETSAYERQRCL
jgi:phosphoglycerol transferase MdoB-like AlkP superfamily enzyme